MVKFFSEMVDKSESAQWEGYEKLTSNMSRFVSDCTRYLIDAYDVTQISSVQEQCFSHVTVLLLVRHIIESIDGVSVLVERGCAENCAPLLRSAFEGKLGVLYILEDHSKRRALSYQVAHAHRKIKMYHKYDPNDTIGKQFRAELKNDPTAEIFDQVSDKLPADLSTMIANLEGMFTKPEFLPIEQEWQVARKKRDRDPEWFALFGGPRDVRSLAYHLKLGATYEGLYRSWSDVIHAGSGLNHIGPSDQPGMAVIRPIRHPDGLESACSLAAQICISITQSLVQKYDPKQWARFCQIYLEKIRVRYLEITEGNMINAPWH